MTKELETNFIADIAELVENRTVIKVGDLNYSIHKLHPVCNNNRVQVRETRNLKSMIDYIRSNPDGLEKANLILHVKSEREVALIGTFDDISRDRETYLVAGLKRTEFPFGRYMESEDFIIKMQTMFEETNDRVKVINFINRLTVGNSVMLEDDGVSQSATVKRGVRGGLKDFEKAPAVVRLKPYRTFHEVKQPESSFLLRLRGGGEQVPTVALFEADGGAWENEAIKGIEEYLRNQVDAVITILA